MKIKIVFITGTMALGGAERQLYYLISCLDKKKYKIYIITLTPGKQDYWGEKMKAVKIPVIGILQKSRIQKVLKIRSIVKRLKPDIIHGWHFYVNGYGVVAGLSRKITVLGGMRNLPNENHINRVPFLWRMLCFYGVDKLISNSLAAKIMLEDNFPQLRNVDYISNGVPVFSEMEIQNIRNSAERQLGKKPHDIFLGYVGQLIPRKNLSLLIGSFYTLSKNFPNIKLIIVGDGWYRSQLEKEVDFLGLGNKVNFVGQIPLAEKLMPAFDIFCLPSNYEGMPNVVMESCAMGIPVIASKVAGTTELIDNQKTGFLFTPGNKSELTSYLEKLLVDKSLRIRMGVEAKELVKNNFSISAMVSLYEDIYTSFIKNEI